MARTPFLPTPSTRIAEAAAAPPGPIDTLLARIAEQRALIAAWAEAAEAARIRHARDIAPLHDSYCALLAEQTRRLDTASALPGLSKADRAALRAWVAELAGTLADATRTEADRAAMQDIQRRHAEAAAARRAAPPPDDDEAPVPPADEPLPDIGDDHDAARAAAERQRAAHHAARLRAKARKAAAAHAAPAQEPPSLRAVYRKVASVLHPDRERDPAARDRKTALMQQANRAYADEDLLALLQLLGDDAPRAEALVPYQALLATQLAALQRQADDAERAYCREFGISTAKRLTPDRALAPLRAQAQQLRDAIAWQRSVLATLPDDADGVRRWLREEKAMRRRWGD